ncbi:phospholipase A1-like [Aphidius gifuensis]|uniref:phospholipase A1-like n=1 Tax=Aphidius gifuensis TaxID=684658 RepID=UPI001CDBE124|nr:phospholipase A1-like [Aphidius gifuensis]
MSYNFSYQSKYTFMNIFIAFKQVLNCILTAVTVGRAESHKVSTFKNNYPTNDNKLMIDPRNSHGIISNSNKFKQREIEQFIYDLIDKDLIKIPTKNGRRFARFNKFCNLTDDGSIVLTDKLDKYHCQLKPTDINNLSLKLYNRRILSPIIDLIFTYNEYTIADQLPKFIIWTNKYSSFNYEYDGNKFNVNKLKPILTYGAHIKIIIPGWQGRHNITWIGELKKSIFDNCASENCYVIVYDWYFVAKSANYFFVADKVKGFVSTFLAKFMVHLVDDGGIYSKHIHIIGFSLGAHVAGCSGYKFGQLSSYDVKVGRITGLDPAGPSFENVDSRDRLSPDDAHFVECIHSCILILGYTDPIGDVDYYSDGGICHQQSMCKNEDYLNNFICGHYSAVAIYNAVIKDRKAFVAKRCSSWSKYEIGQCDDNHLLWVGENDVEERHYGTYVFRSDFLNADSGIYESMFGGVNFELSAWSVLISRRVYTWR